MGGGKFILFGFNFPELFFGFDYKMLFGVFLWSWIIDLSFLLTSVPLLLRNNLWAYNHRLFQLTLMLGTDFFLPLLGSFRHVVFALELWLRVLTNTLMLFVVVMKERISILVTTLLVSRDTS